MDHLRQLPPADLAKPVLVPGDPEEIAMKEVAQNGGIFYTTDHIVTYRSLAEKLNVRPMQHRTESQKKSSFLLGLLKFLQGCTGINA